MQSYPDAAMKKNVNKVSNEFEKILNEEFQHRGESKSKSQDHSESRECVGKKDGKDIDNKGIGLKNYESTKKNDPKTSGDDKTG